MVRETLEQFVTDRDEDTFGGDIVAVASPATNIVLAYLVATLVVGGLVGALLYQNPTLFGDQGYARIAGLVVLGLTVIGVLRLAIKYVVLLRTKYVVTEDSVRREYQLAYREESRELPLHMIRGVELSKGRLQALLGYATISFLAVGSNRGIGYVEFDNAADPEKLQTAVHELLERQEAVGESAPGRTSGRPAAASTPEPTADASATGVRGPDGRTDAAGASESARANEDAGTSDAPRADEGARADDTAPAADDPFGDGSDDPLADDSSDENARRPVSGNDDGQQPDAGQPDD